MVVIGFGVAVAAAGGTASGLGLATYAAIAAGGLLASYVDQVAVYPALFGKKNPKPDALEGFQVSTTDPGAPRWEVYGSRAWVPCHYLWSRNIREEVSGNGQVGKGARPFVQTVRADVGVATCDGPISDIDTMYANEVPFWSRQFNRVVLEDSRWSITAGTGSGAGSLRIEATDADVTDFVGVFNARSSVIDNDGDLVRLERVSPTTLLGYYRVAGVAAHSGTQMSVIAIRPLRGQTPAAGTAGSIFEPAALRRIDQGAASDQWILQGGSVSGGVGILNLRRPANESSIPGLPNQTEQDLTKVWVAGAIYRLDGLSPSSLNGLYKLAARLRWSDPSGTGNGANDYILQFVPVEPTITGGAVTSFGSASLPTIITRDEAAGLSGTNGRGFVFVDALQEWVEYQGTLDQAQDPTLAALEPDAPAHRGIAHLSLKNWNWGPHGNSAPIGLTALVRARSGETVAAAVQRICRRTMPDGHVDVSKLRTKALLGYSIPGGMTSGQALQPIQIMHGVASQDRGGVLTFLDERDLPIVAVAQRHLNARGSDEGPRIRGFIPSRIDPADIPERLTLQYIAPGEGENEAEGDGVRAPGSPDRGKRDTVPVNLKPLVAWPYEVKRRAREIRRRAHLETQRGQLRLPPGYMDVLPATCLTFRANNWQQDVAPAATTIAFDTVLRDLVPRSVAVKVRFAGGQVATLVDDGNGKLEGLPAGITASVNTVDYDDGRIDLTCSVALDTDIAPIIEYAYEKQWLVRASKATLGGYDFAVACDVVKTTTDNPLPPVPRDLTLGLGGAIVSAVPAYRVHVLDIAALYPSQTRSVWISIVAAAEPGSVWRGGVVYQSPNGTDRWAPIGQIQMPTVIGTVPANNLPTTTAGAHPGVVDWTTELEIELPGGEMLDDATTAMIGDGSNWLLIGDEIIGFHEAEAGVGAAWTLRGLVRGLRLTGGSMDTHVDGERVVLLTGLGLHGLSYEPVSGLAAANRTYYFRVVPGGASIDDVSTISQFVAGRSALPVPPQVEAWMLRQRVGVCMELRWFRRSVDQTTLFGPSPLPPGQYERYRVVAFDILTAFGLIGTLGVDGAIAATTTQTWNVGDQQMGTLLVNRLIQYAQVDFLAHGFVLGVTPIGFVIYEVNAVGSSARSDIAFLTPV